MARKKKLNLETAHMADGALHARRTVYELVGIKNTSYRERTFAAYQGQIRKWDLVELHDHAYEVGVVPSPSRDAMIDRLERKYLQENPEQADIYRSGRAAAQKSPEDLSIREQAERIMARGR